MPPALQGAARALPSPLRSGPALRACSSVRVLPLSPVACCALPPWVPQAGSAARTPVAAAMRCARLDSVRLLQPDRSLAPLQPADAEGWTRSG